MMEKTPPTSNCRRKKMTHHPLLDDEQEQQTDSTNSTNKLSLTSTSSSNYQSLDSLISSTSRDECDDSDNNNNNNNNNKIVSTTELKSLHSIHSDESKSSGSKDEVDDAVFSRVNPIARLRGTVHKNNRHACISSSTSITYINDMRTRNPPPPPPPPPIQQQQQQQQPPRHTETALLSLLHELRSVEEQLQQQTSIHANEREELMRQLTLNKEEMKRLERDNELLQRENASLKMKLSTILARLDNFATKCWQFNSASVKKMSEALHIQVHEWSTKLSSSDNISSIVTESSSQAEEEAMRSNTMEKLQSMHLEIQNMKCENRKLKINVKRYQKQCRMDDVSDEVSHMSGVTQMTCATSMTTMTSSTTRLMDAMAGFLNEHEGKCVEEGSTRAGAGKNKTFSVASSPSPPQSILRSTFKYDNNSSNDQRRIILPNLPLSEHPPGVLKSAKVNHGSDISKDTLIDSVSKDQSSNNRRQNSTQKQVNFANFDNAEFDSADSESHRLTRTWGYEEREV